MHGSGKRCGQHGTQDLTARLVNCAEQGTSWTVANILWRWCFLLIEATSDRQMVNDACDHFEIAQKSYAPAISSCRNRVKNLFYFWDNPTQRAGENFPEEFTPPILEVDFMPTPKNKQLNNNFSNKYLFFAWFYSLASADLLAQPTLLPSKFAHF